MAEVLITLGIIGVVAAITMPTIMANVQKTILKNQFKSAYSKFSQAVFQAQARMDYPVECFYWTTGVKYATKCDQWDEYGCTHWAAGDGSPLPSDVTGLRSGCPAFEEELFTKTLKVVKFCQDHALTNGCLTDEYRGVDKVKKEQNPDVEVNPNQLFSDSNIKNNYSSWVLSDGMVIIKYGKYGYTDYSPIYTIDINGHKGPNKWGYDIFTLTLKGDYDGIKKIDGANYANEKGGTSSTDMVKNAFSK